MLDFGLAKVVDVAGTSTAATDAPLSGAGTTVGTVAYMSPEQARGEEVDARSDLFSFGAVLYEMATGQPAFQAATTALTYDAILNRPPADPRPFSQACPRRSSVSSSMRWTRIETGGTSLAPRCEWRSRRCEDARPNQAGQRATASPTPSIAVLPPLPT